MKAKRIVKGVGNTAKVLAEGLFPTNTLENQILTLESLKSLVEQAQETRTRLLELMELVEKINTMRVEGQEKRERDADNQKRDRDADNQKRDRDADNQKRDRDADNQNDPEERLIEFLAPRLKDKHLLDVGAHRGHFTTAMLRIGFKSIHAFEPHPELSRSLGEQYRNDPRVTVHPFAVSEMEGSASLHLVQRSSNDSGDVDPLLFSSLSPHNMPPGLEFRGEVPIECRSLASLAAAGAIPPQAAVLKIDAEGCDLSVMKGMPSGAPYEIIISEFWSDDFVFATPGIPSQRMVREYLCDHGYPHSISIIRRQDDSLCFTANMLPRTPQVWGNTLYFRDLDLFDAAYTYMRNTMTQVV